MYFLVSVPDSGKEQVGGVADYPDSRKEEVLRLRTS
jgi:hypothetical protein